MTATPDGRAANATDALQAEIERLRGSDVLGAQGRLRDLFEFLVRRSAENAPPKEAEIALEVFGKADSDASRDDPVARVYIHRLRKRLDDFYLRNGTASGVRLDIPRGEYRIVGVDSAAERPASSASSSEAERPPRKRLPLIWAATAFALVLAGNVAAWAILARPVGSAQGDIRRTPVWTAMSHSQRPLIVVVGDYYIFGEYEDRVFLKRLVRDFAINSKDDLVRRYANDPKTADKYSDVALQYLPTSAAYALTDLAPLIDGRGAEVILASELTPDKIKTNDVIYVGLLSGMGALKDVAFGQSRFSIGESYDQIIDHKLGMTYTSEAFVAAPAGYMYRDYGFFSSFRGPTGNRIAILAGTRDTALMGVAEALTRTKPIDALIKEAGRAEDFEAVFEVSGQQNFNLDTKPIATAALDSQAMWSGERADRPSFPTE